MEVPNTTPDEIRKVDPPRPDDEVHQHREQRAAYGVDPRDGLARPVSETTYEQTYVPPLNPSTFVCMADETEFVMYAGPRGDDSHGRARVLARFRAADVQVFGGQHGVPRELALQHVPEAERHLIAWLTGSDLVWVMPARRACKYYARQMTDMSGNPGRKFISRFCMAQRDENGEYVSLRDSLVYACDLRDPTDSVSRKLLDDFDAQKVRDGLERKEEAEHEFDVDAALREQEVVEQASAQDLRIQTGIFDREVVEEAEQRNPEEQNK